MQSLTIQQGRNSENHKSTTTSPYSTYCMDRYIYGIHCHLPKPNKKSVIMVVVDRLSKYAHFCALQHPFKASTDPKSDSEACQCMKNGKK